MGLFDFLNKPKHAASVGGAPKSQQDRGDIPKEARFMAQLEISLKQINNLHAVGRKADANKEFGVVLGRYYGLFEPCTESDVVRISYYMAFTLLPHVIFNDWEKFCEIRDGYMPTSKYFAMSASLPIQRSMNHEQLLPFKVFLGPLSRGSGNYFAVRFPNPPPFDANDYLAQAQRAAAEGRALNPEERRPPAPYFAAVLENANRTPVEYLVFCQNPSGGASLRSVTTSQNLKVAACMEATKEKFIELIKDRLC